MARKQHLSRLAVPKTWPLEKKKGIKWITKPAPGSHALHLGVPALVLLRDILNIVQASKQAKQILNAGEVLVNGKAIKFFRFSVGLFDVVSIPKLKKHFRIVFSQKGKLTPIEISPSDANILPVQILNKTVLKKGKLQLNLSNGWNMLSEKGSFKTGDVLLYDLAKKKIINHLKLDKGCHVYFVSGRHIGRVATLNSIKEIGVLKKKRLAILKSGKETFETTLDNLVVIGKTKPEIKVKTQ